MHPRFLQFIDRVRERPQEDRRMIAFSLALAITAVLVSARAVLFPLADTEATERMQFASIGETFSVVTDDLSVQAERLREQVDVVTGRFHSPEEVAGGSQPASVPLAPNGSAGATAPAEGWAPSPEGYYYEYPTSAR